MKNCIGVRPPTANNPKCAHQTIGMLKSIYIRNFAIIDKLELGFFTGMNVLTGETGAGKSIIIDALYLALGKRADRSVARDPNNKVEVAATFDISAATPHAIAWLKEHDFYMGYDCILRRVISSGGKSKAYINDSPCSVTMLHHIGGLFIDIYGQHEHQSLIHKDKQRELLDGFAGNKKRVTRLAALYRLWKDLTDQLQHIESKEENTRSQLEWLQYQHYELERLDVNKDEYEELHDQYMRLSHAGELHEKSMDISLQLAGESDDALYDRLHRMTSELEKFVSIDERLKGPLDDLQSIHIQLKDTAGTLRDYAEQLSPDPRALQTLGERIAAIEEIARKHKVKPAQLFALRASIATELQALEHERKDTARIKRSIHETECQYQTLATEINAARKQAADELNEKISNHMQSLGMRGGCFQIDVQTRDYTAPTLNGPDDIQFTVGTNPGQSPRPMNKVASGGELSRLGLAIQITTVNNLKIPTLIFDEVDAGVGGATAEVVGRHLRRLSGEAQVLCVTHLPQVAAQAHHHYKVDKLEQDGGIATEISHLTKDARIKEIARMLSGIKTTQNTREHAKEMLCQIGT